MKKRTVAFLGATVLLFSRERRQTREAFSNFYPATNMLLARRERTVFPISSAAAVTHSESFIGPQLSRAIRYGNPRHPLAIAPAAQTAFGSAGGDREENRANPGIVAKVVLNVLFVAQGAGDLDNDPLTAARSSPRSQNAANLLIGRSENRVRTNIHANLVTDFW